MVSSSASSHERRLAATTGAFPACLATTRLNGAHDGSERVDLIVLAGMMVGRSVVGEFDGFGMVGRSRGSIRPGSRIAISFVRNAIDARSGFFLLAARPGIRFPA